MSNEAFPDAVCVIGVPAELGMVVSGATECGVMAVFKAVSWVVRDWGVVGLLGLPVVPDVVLFVTSSVVKLFTTFLYRA